MKKLLSALWNTTAYKIACICTFILIPAYPFCIFPQPFSVILLVWGAAILLRDVFTKRSFFRQTGTLLLALFCLGYAITILLFAGSNKVSTLNLYCWTIVEFFILFALGRDKPGALQTSMKDLYSVNKAVSCVALIAGSFCMFCYLFKISATIHDFEGVNGVWFLGVVSGRNSGIFNNPISCANAMFVGCVASLFNIVYPKKKTWYGLAYYILAFVICWLCINTTLTRTYVFGLYVLVFVAAFVAVFQLFSQKKGKALLRWGAAVSASVVLVVCLVAGTAVGKFVIRSVSEQLPTVNVYDILGESHFDGEDGEDGEGITIIVDENVNTSLVRDEIGRLPNFFYPRTELWKVGLQVIPHSPILGYTTGDMNSSSLKYGDTPYFRENCKDGIFTYHNAYFDITASAGFLGLGLILGFLLLQIVRTLKVVLLKKLPTEQKGEVCGFGISVGYLAVHVFMTCLFLGVLCLTNVSVCIYFWIILGFVSRVNDQILGDRKVLSIENVLCKVFKKR